MPYALLWEELELVSFANLTRKEEPAFTRVAPTFSTVTQTTSYTLEQANQALDDLRAGQFEGPAALVPGRRSVDPRISRACP